MDKDSNVTFYWKRDTKFTPLFNQTLELVDCSDIKRVLFTPGADEYDPNSWRLFIETSKCSLKCVLLHNIKKYASIATGHSTTLKEMYDPTKKVME